MTSASGHETEKKTGPEKGPYSDKTTTTYKLSGLELTIETKRESSHVPPDEDCGCGGAGPSAPNFAFGTDSPLGVLVQEFGKRVLEMLYKIQAQTAPLDSDPDPSGSSH